MWDDEIDIVDRAISIGKAPDTITKLHGECTGQFARIADLRMQLLRGPKPFHATAVYYCDRSINSLLPSIIHSRKNINEMFTDLAKLRSECFVHYPSAQKTLALVELQFSPDSPSCTGHLKVVHQLKQTWVLAEVPIQKGSHVSNSPALTTFTGQRY